MSILVCNGTFQKKDRNTGKSKQTNRFVVVQTFEISANYGIHLEHN